MEWKPTSTKIAASTGSTTTTAVASILQISSSSRVFIIDLLALQVRGSGYVCLHGYHRTNPVFVCQDNDFLFDSFLGRLFTCPFLLKVGFGFDTDLKGTELVAVS